MEKNTTSFDRKVMLQKIRLAKGYARSSRISLLLSHMEHEIIDRGGWTYEEHVRYGSESYRNHDAGYVTSLWKEFLQKNPSTNLSLYVHIPFCPRRCKFCMYYSTELENRQELEKYLAYLVKEAQLFSPIFSTKRFESLYIGGGTPSLFSPEQIEALFSAIYKNFDVGREGEITFSALPDTLNESKLKAISRHSNRISMGVQSLDREVLERNNRTYDSYECLSNLAKAIHGLKFREFNIDLIEGLEGDTKENFLNSIKGCLRLGPTSISIYKVKKGKNFAIRTMQGRFPHQKGNITVGEDYHFSDYLRDLYDETKTLCERYGYHFSYSENYLCSVLQKNKAPKNLTPHKKYLTNYNPAADNSILGIGAGSESILGFFSKYFSVTDVKKDGGLYGTDYYLNILEPKDRARTYLLGFLVPYNNNLSINLLDFNTRLGLDLLDTFCEEMEILRKLSLVIIAKDQLIFVPQNELELSFLNRFFRRM